MLMFLFYVLVSVMVDRGGLEFGEWWLVCVGV